MIRPLALFLALVLFLWVLPLGAFIKKGTEETVCGGKRAFHMCCLSAGSLQAKDPGPLKTAFTSPSGAEDPQPLSGGSTVVTVDLVDRQQTPDPASFHFVASQAPRPLTFLAVPKPVPKA